MELTSILDNPIIKQILGVVLGGGVTGFMMQVREQVNQGTQEKLANTREQSQLNKFGAVEGTNFNKRKKR